MANLKNKTLYTLAVDVKNPKPDRRTAERDVFMQPVLKAGLRLRAEANRRRSPEEISELPEVARAIAEERNIYWTLVPASSSFYGGTGTISEHSSPVAVDREGEPKGPTLWELLLADGVLVETAPEDADDVVRAAGHRTHDAGFVICVAVDRLVKEGKITLADFAAAMKRGDE